MFRRTAPKNGVVSVFFSIISFHASRERVMVLAINRGPQYRPQIF